MDNVRNKYLSDKIKRFDSDIKFLSNKDEKNNDIESLISEYLSNNIKLMKNSNTNLEKDRFINRDNNNKKDKDRLIKIQAKEEQFIKEIFEEINKNENNGKLNLIKNLNLEEKIKEDFTKKNFKRDLLLNKSLNNTEDRRVKLKKYQKFTTCLSFIYLPYFYSIIYRHKKDRPDKIKDILLNKPIPNKTNSLYIFLNIIPLFMLIYSWNFLNNQIKEIDKLYLNYFGKEMYIDLNEDISEYKFHNIKK
jgi:hypothetical protein